MPMVEVSNGGTPIATVQENLQNTSFTMPKDCNEILFELMYPLSGSFVQASTITINGTDIKSSLVTMWEHDSGNGTGSFLYKYDSPVNKNDVIGAATFANIPVHIIYY